MIVTSIFAFSIGFANNFQTSDSRTIGAIVGVAGISLDGWRVFAIQLDRVPYSSFCQLKSETELKDLNHWG